MGPGQSKWIIYHSKQNSQNKETDFLLNPCSITDSCPAAWPLSILTSPYTIRTTTSNYNNVFQHVYFTDLMEGDTHLSSRVPSSPESKASFTLPTQKPRGAFRTHPRHYHASWASNTAVWHTLLCILSLCRGSARLPLLQDPLTHPTFSGWAPVPSQAPSWALRIRHQAPNPNMILPTSF